MLDMMEAETERSVVPHPKPQDVHANDLNSIEDPVTVRLYLGYEDTDLDVDDDHQPPGVVLLESHLIVASSTIRAVLAKKRSDSAVFDTKDAIVWDYRVSQHGGGFFSEYKGIYLPQLISFAANAEGSFLGVASSAKTASALTPKQLLRAVETWVAYIAEDELYLGSGSLEAAMAVGKVLGAEEDYLQDLEEFYQTGKVTSSETGINSERTPGMATNLPSISPDPFVIPQVSDVRDTTLQPGFRSLDDILGNTVVRQVIPPEKEPNSIDFPFKYVFPESAVWRIPNQRHELTDCRYVSMVPRVRIYVTPDRNDLPFDHPDQPHYLDLPESLACENSALIEQVLELKRDQAKRFDLQDEMIWDPRISRTTRKFPPPYTVVYLEEIALDLCMTEGDPWITEIDGKFSMQEWAYEVKHLMLGNISEVWDGAKTWIDYIKTKRVTLSCPHKTRHNIMDVAIFLGAKTTYIQKLRSFVENGDQINLKPRRGRTKPSKGRGRCVLEPPDFQMADEQATLNIERKMAERSRSPQKGPISDVRRLKKPDYRHDYYRENFGKESGPLSVSRSNDTNQVIEDDFLQTFQKRARNPPIQAPAQNLPKSATAGKKKASRKQKPAQATTSRDAASQENKVDAPRSSAKPLSVAKPDMDSTAAVANGDQAGWVRRSERRRTAVQPYQSVSESPDSKPKSAVSMKKPGRVSKSSTSGNIAGPSTPESQPYQYYESLYDASPKRSRSQASRNGPLSFAPDGDATSNVIPAKIARGAVDHGRGSGLGMISTKADKTRKPSGAAFDVEGVKSDPAPVVARNEGSSKNLRKRGPATAPAEWTSRSKRSRKGLVEQ